MGPGDGKHLVPVLNLMKTFEGHDESIRCIATYPDGKRIATSSADGTIRIWRLEDGREMKKWVIKKNVWGLFILKDGTQIIRVVKDLQEDIGLWNEELWVGNAETGRIIAALDGHSNRTTCITRDISRDGGIFAIGSPDHTVIFWDETTLKRNGILDCGAPIDHIRFSQTGQLGVATHKDIQIWDLGRMERLAQFNGHADFDNGWYNLLAWTRDGLHLLCVRRACGRDLVIRSWDTSIWKQAGGPWTASSHNQGIFHITLNQAGTLLASISADHTNTFTIRLWSLFTRTEVGLYEHLPGPSCPVAFSADGRFIFGGIGNKLLQWEIPEDVLATACGDSLVTRSRTASAGLSLCNQKNAKSLLDMEIPGQRRAAANKDLANLGRSRPWTIRTPIEFGADVDGLPPSRVNGIPKFFNRIRPSPDTKRKERQHRANIMTPETVDVPLGLATYGDYVASDEDRIRPYSLFFCLGWFQKKEKKLDPPLQLYDVDIMKAEQDHDPLNVPAPTTTGVADG